MMPVTDSVVLRLNERVNELKRTISTAQQQIDQTEMQIKSLEIAVAQQHAVIERSQYLLAELEHLLGPQSDPQHGAKEAGSLESFVDRAVAKIVGRRQRPIGRAAEAILEFLQTAPNGLTGPQIADHLENVMPSTSPRPRNMVFSTLYNLRNAGRVTFDETTGVYRPASVS